MVRAFIASVVATAITSVLVYVNARMAFVPQLDFLSEIAAFNGRIGLPTTENGVWATHLAIGVLVYGVAFACLQPVLPGRGALAGLWFGALAFVAMMASFMPLAGRAIFATDLGGPAIAVLLALHLVYGLVVGVSYAALTGKGSATH